MPEQVIEWQQAALLVAGIIGLVALGIVILVSLSTVRPPNLRNGRRHLRCPLRGRAADVDFLVEVAAGAFPRDVVRCSLFAPGAPVDCAKTCRFLPAVRTA
jgi:hypothetical protein